MTHDDAHLLAVEVPELIDEVKGLRKAHDDERAEAVQWRRAAQRKIRTNRIIATVLALLVAAVLGLSVQAQFAAKRDEENRQNSRQTLAAANQSLQTLLAYSDPNSEVVKKSKEDQALVIAGLVAAIRQGVREDLAAVLRCQSAGDQDALTACLLERLPPITIPTPSPTPGADAEG